MTITNNQTVTKKITFDNLMKEFKHYVATTNIRPVLTNVHYDGNSFTATDSHTLLKVNADYVSDIPDSLTVGSLYDPVAMELSADTSNYPNTERILQRESKLHISIDTVIGDMQNLMKEGNKELKGQRSLRLFRFNVDSDYLTVKALKDITNEHEEIINKEVVYMSKLLIGNKITLGHSTERTFSLNGSLLTRSLIVAKKLARLSSNSLQLKIESNTSPIKIEQEDVFTIVIMPVRDFI